jgi:hypothetical protein
MAVAGAAVGCGHKEEPIEIKTDGVTQAKQLLQAYAKGQRLGSESTSYEYHVKQVREVDPAKADILEKGLAEIAKTSGPATAAKAKELLKKLGWDSALIEVK